ncbi:Splicing factor 3 subunit 1 [Wickerhamomyces ciferrii]|uniref:Splicing factor 3 subunit 1 n=1 Tax=Wickerhamomyces ciferrii (strain ATCC 14091 / BCRC 22168 / CBS 111 / JCM 3599 / NBRC 0793 / NRRL Y-1031 F-60-10) TaxID=1206466 RepID=K0KDM9_WICCF|nr:Splicing factor 3 subunit 1 [Wickerhamomyces ciferrii]CCH43220.1 Splicing factor 3 subunit 1 [Wickerhamomyces ciferrii]
MSLEIPEDIIIPPPAIKEIVLKTANYVYRNGKQFENKIRENESNNKNFTFVNENDPYNQYYQFVLENIESFIEVDDAKGADNDEKVQNIEDQFEKPLDLDFIIELPPITVKDLEIIKLTSQFVAINGESYITSIRNKYKDQTAQFSFLNNDHSFHQLFLKYLKQYRKLIDESELLDLDHDVLDESYKRAKWNEAHKQNNQKIKKELEEKKLKFASIDWDNFIIVETIDITEIDSHTEFPLPLTIADLQYRSLESKSEQLVPNVKPIDIDETKSLTNSNMKIRSYGETRLQRGKQHSNNGEKLIECPITGRLIPESGFEKHIQILLRDPKYKLEKANYESKIKNSNLTTSEVVSNIKNLFKPPNKETGNKRQKVQWDGYQSSINYVKQQNKNDGLNNEEIEELKRKRNDELNKIGPQLPK